MSAPVIVGPTSSSGDPKPPTLEQLLILVARAERKGGLDCNEGNRLREGLCCLAGEDAGTGGQDSRVSALHRRYESARKRAWVWKTRALAAGYGTSASSPGEPDEEARAALMRVVDLATRWTHIPARRQAGASVLAVLSNHDDED